MAPLATAGRGLPREGSARRALARLGAPQYQVRQAGTPAGAHAAARLGGPLARLRAVAALLLNLQGASDNRPLYIVQFTSLALALVSFGTRRLALLVAGLYILRVYTVFIFPSPAGRDARAFRLKFPIS